jgi:hypothetical protein
MAKGDFVLKVNNVSMPCPSAFEWSLQDVSASESGRTDDALMHKNRVAQKRKIVLTWSSLTASETSKVLKAFNNEYFDVYYWDAMDGKYETRKFYAGDRKAPVKNWWVGNQRFETVSFDIIER